MNECSVFFEEAIGAFSVIHTYSAQRRLFSSPSHPEDPSTACGSPDFLPLPPHTHSHSSRLDLKLGLRFWYSDKEGVKGATTGGEGVWGVGIGARWQDKNVLERARSMFTSLPVLTFKMLNRGLDQPIRKEIQTHGQWPCLHAASGFPHCMIISSFFIESKHTFVFLLQQAVQLFPNCGVGKKVNPKFKRKYAS